MVPESRPTEALVAGAAADLFDSLPPEYQARLEELPDLLDRLERGAEALRLRGAELERALGTVGTVGLAVDRSLAVDEPPGNSAGLGSVQAHRAKAADDLESARSVIGTRLSATVAALENLRLGLLRLQAGVGTPDELTRDLKAAKEIGLEVEALFVGQTQVEGILGTRESSAMGSSPDHQGQEG
jgi:hypothetical protein